MEDCEQPEWTIFSETVKEKGSEHCGVTTGGKSMQKRETWWWNTTVQEAIAWKRGCSRSGNNRKHKKIMPLTKRQRQTQREPYQLKEQEQHNNCMRNWTLEKAKRLYMGIGQIRRHIGDANLAGNN